MSREKIRLAYTTMAFLQLWHVLLTKNILQIIFNDVLKIRIDIINISNTILVFQYIVQ